MRYLLLLFWSVATLSLFGQKIKRPEDAGFSAFVLPASGDSIRFLVADTSAALNQRKAVFLFIQGSLPTPVLITNGEAAYSPFPFDIRPYQNEYHFVVVSKPGLPIMTHVNALDAQFNYLDPDTKRPPKAYSDQNYLDAYVLQHQTVIDWLVQQSWVDASKIVVCGGSQGARIGAHLAAAKPAVTHLIYFSGNPNGRMDEEVRRIQRDELLGKISPETAVEKLESLQAYWKWAFENAQSTDVEQGDSPKTSTSFSVSSRACLTSLNIPILVAYGTADLTAAPCATLPIDFFRLNKTNLTLKAYPNYDHHFFKQNLDGKEPEYKMDEAFKEWMLWLK
jgi:hypothetical protein